MNRRNNRPPRFGPLLLLLLLPASGLFPQEAEIPEPAAFSLDQALGVLGAELRWDPLFRAGTLGSGGHSLAFQAGEPGSEGPVLLDNRETLLLPVPYLDGGSLVFPGDFVTRAKEKLDSLEQQELSRMRIAAIVVDPGHGGKDQGASATHVVRGKSFTLVEKDLTLKVSRNLHAMLSAAYPDKQILLTRTGDTYPTLDDRVAIANSVPLRDNEAVIYLSIHANASFAKTARGYEIWYLSPEYRRTLIDETKRGESAELLHILNDMMEEEFTTESIAMAQLILNQFRETLGPLSPSRGIKAEDWFVVRNARMPSILVEMGFVTNETEALLLADDSYLMKLSQALYKGIMQFVAVFERSGGFTSIE
ncbi:MAG: N-acetylmuramoyl-L-alanine amidase [Treponema sp.]|jgi:N-acetylmuramoyl-L-alanine amidase|nr:N-acetylmuramoyl-L-alanine amidase [Treponema sp.]